MLKPFKPRKSLGIFYSSRELHVACHYYYSKLPLEIGFLSAFIVNGPSRLSPSFTPYFHLSFVFASQIKPFLYLPATQSNRYSLRPIYVFVRISYNLSLVVRIVLFLSRFWRNISFYLFYFWDFYCNCWILLK